MDPRVRVIFTSGFTGNVLEKKGVFREGIDFLPKPLLPQVLLPAVRRVLDTRA